jgi:hypothetical protein
MRMDRLHVWHMKVLRYTVFNDQKVATLEKPDRDIFMSGLYRTLRTRIEPRGRSLKAEQYSREQIRVETRLSSGTKLPLLKGSDVRKRSLNRSRRDPQLDISHNWPANPWMHRHRLWST